MTVYVVIVMSHSSPQKVVGPFETREAAEAMAFGLSMRDNNMSGRAMVLEKP